ncbi:MAG: PAS domain S-box protein [Mangrovibacterium sp.]
MITDLIQNATLLITLIVLYGLISRRKITYSLASQLINGFLFGGIAIIGMKIPITYSPGVFYDGRTIVLSLAGLFGGGITTIISVILAIIYRLNLGGPGIWAGIASIISSALVGTIFRHYYKSKPESVNVLGLVVMGLVSYITMLLCQLLLPWPSGVEIIQAIWLPVLMIFPATTVIMGVFLRSGLRRFLADESIHKNEVLYRTTLHSIGDAVMTTEQNGKITYLNPVAEQLTGWTEQQAIGTHIKSVFRIIHEDTGQEVDCPVKVALHEGQTVSLANHTLLVSKQGEKIPIATSGAPIRDENGNIIGAVLVFRDQTNERRKQREIRESRERFIRAVENFPDLVVICDLNKKVQFVNGTVAQLTGQPASFFMGKTEETIWPEEIREEYLPVLRQMIRTGEPQHLKISANFPKTGKKYLDMCFVPLTDSEGKIYEFMVIANDFTIEKQVTDELHAREIMFHTLTEQSPVGIFHTDSNGYTTYVNPKWCELSGLNPEQALGNELLKAVHPDDRKAFQKSWEHGIHSDQPSLLEYRFLKPDGTQTWVLGETVPEITSDGKILGYIGTITDITEQKKAEQALVQSRENFRQSMDESPLGMRILTEKGKTLYINKALLDIYGFSSIKEYQETPIEKRYTENGIKLHLQRKERRKRGENVESEYEIEIKRRDGSIRNVHVYRKMIIWDGKLQCLVIYQDQTERKKAEDALIKSENSLKESQEIAQIGSWEYNMTENKTEWSENCYRLFGRQPGEITPSYDYFRSTIIQEDLYIMDEGYEKILAKKEPISIRFRIVLPDKGIKWMLNKIFPEFVNGELVKLRGMIMDITESVKVIADLEQAKNKAEESDRLKSAFLANMSHEIRTPLNTILGFSSILTSDEEISPEEKEEYTSIINRSSDNLLQIINDILDISKLETGQLKIFKKLFDVRIVLDELNRVFTKRLTELDKNDIKLKVKTVSEPLFLNQDRVRFYQIFMNLLSNSAKFTEKGEIQFGVSEITGNIVSFFVSDTGIGIPKELQAAIFERFRQVDETSTKVHGGTGLGLSIVKNLVELMGGDITIESASNKGTLFRFTLPIEK